MAGLILLAHGGCEGIWRRAGTSGITHTGLCRGVCAGCRMWFDAAGGHGLVGTGTVVEGLVDCRLQLERIAAGVFEQSDGGGDHEPGAAAWCPGPARAGL